MQPQGRLILDGNPRSSLLSSQSYQQIQRNRRSGPDRRTRPGPARAGFFCLSETCQVFFFLAESGSAKQDLFDTPPTACCARVQAYHSVDRGLEAKVCEREGLEDRLAFCLEKC